MANSILQDRDGNESSKRVMGYILSFIGVSGLIVTGVLSWFKEIPDPKTAVNVFSTILIAGAGLLGISVFEFMGKKDG